MAQSNNFLKSHCYSLVTAFIHIGLIATSVISSDPISSQHLLGFSFSTPGIKATFDFVIVGGGTADLVLANRLLESGEHTVAVIEAGGFYEHDNGNNAQVPRYVWNGADTSFYGVNPLVDWAFETEPEAGIGGQKIHYTRGRTLGGSSARNNMIYNGATEGTYKKWADYLGDASYEWENFREYFDRSVTFNHADTTKRLANSAPPDDIAGSRATSGPVQLSYANHVLPFTSWAMQALAALGMKPLAGYIDGDLTGSGWAMQTTYPKTKIRDSSETAYLSPVLERTNLVVYQSTVALKILFDGTEAVGVSCQARNDTFKLLPRREVVFSAGAIQSPQLLMVSGIGPKETLEKSEIPVLVDAPEVGSGLEVLTLLIGLEFAQLISYIITLLLE